MLKVAGYQHTLLIFGLIIGIIGGTAALGLRRPRPNERLPTPSVMASANDVPTRVMLRTKVFWLMFVMHVMMSTGGLMIISQFAAFSRDYGVTSVTIFGIGALPFALTIDRIANGLTRPFFGWLADRIGRENTMAFAFIMEAVAVTTMVLFRDNPLIFVILSAVVFFGWGEIFSVFPATLADTFGTKYATTNYGCLFIAQGVGSILGAPFAAMLHNSTESWLPVFAIIISVDVLTGILALGALKPLRRTYLAATRQNPR
jgi:MFS transporter, OFA family, oxalate/formate antiporter